jgi:hypothetical protein
LGGDLPVAAQEGQARVVLEGLRRVTRTTAPVALAFPESVDQPADQTLVFGVYCLSVLSIGMCPENFSGVREDRTNV